MLLKYCPSWFVLLRVSFVDINKILIRICPAPRTLKNYSLAHRTPRPTDLSRSMRFIAPKSSKYIIKAKRWWRRRKNKPTSKDRNLPPPIPLSSKKLAATKISSLNHPRISDNSKKSPHFIEVLNPNLELTNSSPIWPSAPLKTTKMTKYVPQYTYKANRPGLLKF